ncbi:monovalent cation/H+ antiporter subunit D family protein [Salinisphaera sp. Q1T1-3]|uniref:monovalent cation/H+ antiporter subunit D family protein n=1 Tax=Salinisphaera sp. Q1T1-3 TaxID=2321229 RepID=UPI000E75CF94|nr:monovalent cation/H+ antiporter subunit D family protein [Salinisphaera sp. Q1T1-3]RJS93125.1 monovalent cation/H+ antiporter subunit D family protein [Salinisphaera sp. Q1T1-3]
MITHFFNQMPALVVVVPMLAAPLVVLAHRQWAAWLIFVGACWAIFGMAFLLFVEAKIAGQVSYAVGGWAPPFGIQLVIDPFNALVLLLVTGVAALTSLYARASIAAEIVAERGYLVYALLLLCIAGLVGITITGDAFNLFVFLEISSLSSYALIAMGPKRRALLSAFQYLIMGTVGGTFLLIGIGLVFMMTGTLNMADLASRLPPVADTHTVQAALAFIVVGLSLKAALFPLHVWLPNAYTYAPSVVSAFISATATKVAVYAVFRFVFTVFGVDYAFGTLPLGEVLLVLSAIAMIAASLAAIFQTDVKRLLAWSSIAQMGYIVAGFALATPDGISAGLVHLLNHGLIKGALFMAVGALFWRLRGSSINDLAGMGRAMPVTSAAFVVGGLSLIGVPATAGFISKWVLLSALFEAHRYLLVAMLLLASLLSIIYVGRVIEALYFRARPDDVTEHAHGEAPLGMQLATWALIAANIAIGLHATPELGAAQRAAAGLMGGGT